MDKVETTKELADFITYNKEDISALKRDYPEVSDVFGNLLLAIDKKYGSGELKKEDFESAAKMPQIVPLTSGDMYENPKGEVYEILSSTGDNFNDTVTVRNVKNDRKYNPYRIDILKFIESGEWKKVDMSKVYQTQTPKQTTSGLTPGNKNDEDKAATDLVGKTYVVRKGDEFVITRVLVKGPANISFMIKDKKTGIDVKLRLGRSYMIPLLNGQKTPKGNYIKEFQTGATQQTTQQPPRQSNTVTSPEFSVGDMFTIPKDQTKGTQVYRISDITAGNMVGVEWDDNSGYNEVKTYTVSGVNSSFRNGVWVKYFEANQAPVSTNPAPQYKSPWRPDWKSKGFRTGPQRSGGMAAEGEYGMGYDGSIWKAVKDSSGVQKWVRQKGMNPIASSSLVLLSKNDLYVLLDQKGYEMSTIDPKIMKDEYDDAAREKQIVLNEINKR